MTENGKTLVFFDGVCGLCNGFVDFLFKVDMRGIIAVAALQGKTAQQLLPADLLGDLQTIVVRRKDGALLIKSEGVLHVLIEVGGHWGALAKIATMVPRFVRDLVYDLVAKSRYPIFGKRQTCRLPTNEERSRFLD